jgi:hypothetical protein
MSTNELISWITLPASFTTETVSVNGSPAWTFTGGTDASRWKPLEIARTCVVLVGMEFVTFCAVICWNPPVDSRMLRSARPSVIAVSEGSSASGSPEERRITSVTPATGFHQASVAYTVTVNAKLIDWSVGVPERPSAVPGAITSPGAMRTMFVYGPDRIVTSLDV